MIEALLGAAVYELLRDNPHGLTVQQVRQATGEDAHTVANVMQKLRIKKLIRVQKSDAPKPLWFAVADALSDADRDAFVKRTKCRWPAEARFDRPGMEIKTRMVPIRPARNGRDVTAEFLGDPAR